MSATRRHFLKQVGGGLLAAGGLLALPRSARAECQRVSGAGSYRLGPFDPAQPSDEMVYLVTDLGFDETMVYCKVTTNFAPFRFVTAKMGTVLLDAHEFFMDMRSIRIDSLEVVQSEDGPRAVYQGSLRVETRLFSGSKMKTFVEDKVRFGCHAIKFGAKASIDISKNNFSMTANFDPSKEHASIFGEQATFAGHVTQGSIIVVA